MALTIVLSVMVLVLFGLVHDLKGRVLDLEKQVDADRGYNAWEARLSAAEDRVLDTAIRCESREMERGWSVAEGRK